MIKKAQIEDLYIIAQLACCLWPHHTPSEMEEEITAILTQTEAAFFLAYDEHQPIGFAQCQLRHDYVEGTESTPVGYLEGIYVAPDFRKQGIAKLLLASCEAWAKEQGCREFASDCELCNAQSLSFHLHAGFEEANRIICFVKRLNP